MRTTVGTSAVMVLFSMLAACGEEHGSVEPDETGRPIVAGTPPAATPKPDPVVPSTSAAGTWTMDVDQMLAVGIDAAKNLAATIGADAKAKGNNVEIDAAKQAQMTEMMKAMLKDAKMEFTLEVDHSAHWSISGMMRAPARTGEGTWTQAGDQVKIHPTSMNGKPPKGGDAQDLEAVLVGDTLRTTTGSKGMPAMVLRRK